MSPFSSCVAILVASLLWAISDASTLFPFEQRQLTREYAASLPEEDAQMFAFGDSSDNDEITAINAADKRCRYGPSDGKFPSENAWQKLAKQLSKPELLIKTTPQASPCYGDSKNDATCQDLTATWRNPYTHVDDPTEVLYPLYQGLTCQPPTIYDSGTCTLGGYPSYVVEANTVLDIQLAINLARNDYLRLIVKNTGHDVVGKSVGHGALSIWTHALKDIQYFDNYVDESGYQGPAIKVGAGVRADELYKAASEHGVTVVAGHGQTVGVVGGYMQGGGHSPLSSVYGMAADQVLGFEIVTSTGEFLTANSTSNLDLFWAVRGGGGGTFGIVTSATIKAFKDMPVAASSWTLDSSKIGLDKFWSATQAFVDRVAQYSDNGTYSHFSISSNANGKDYMFTVQPFLAPNKTAKEVNSILGSFLSRLTALNIPFSPKITEYKGFYPAWESEFPLEEQSDVSTIYASRLLPRSNFASETGRNITFNVLRQTVEAGHALSAFSLAPTLSRAAKADNAINPAWRTSVLDVIVARKIDPKAPASDMLSLRASFTNGTMQRWRDVTPGSEGYLNEADRMEPDWQRSFWGDKYGRLLEIKREWDRKDLFWAANAVGSEGWRVESADGLPSENGKLCVVE